MIKFLITTAAIMFLGLAGVSYSKADECAISTKAEAHEQMSKIPGVQLRTLSKSEVAKIIDKKGPPPNAVEGTDIEMELVQKEEIAGINVYQGECFINRLGPTRMDTIKKLLDEVDA